MGPSDPMADSFQTIALQPVKRIIGINPMVLTSPWNEYIDIISLKSLI